ncbi:unnamed protein product [Caenorhabditis bovis]|uniref:Anoctamin n=1 Tax=Caenorhabditis bovis TaxID=2654633 RepID=A0A8S1EUW0_9PELO|nr:unnamed protein product [Caenorhabditis bovis]
MTSTDVKKYDIPLHQYRMLAASTDVDYPYFPFRISIDFVLVHNSLNSSKHRYRQFFEKAAAKEGLVVRNEKVDDLEFTLISTPFHRLCREAELSQMSFPLKDCPIAPAIPSCCVPLSRVFVTDDTVRFVNAPFQRKNGHLFANYTNERQFLTPAQKGFLTHQILARIDVSRDVEANRVDGDANSSAASLIADAPLRRKGLNWLLMQDAYTDAFVLHAPSTEEPYFREMKTKCESNYTQFIAEIDDDPRKSLGDSWRRWLKFQPLNKIREYFGEQIAYYFAWQGTFVTLLWPATIFGLIVFVSGLVDGVGEAPWRRDDDDDAPLTAKLAEWLIGSFDTPMNAVYAVFMSIWGSVFVQIWRRNNSVLSYEWNVEEIHVIEPDRPEFRGSKTTEDPITGEDIWISPAVVRYLRLVASFLFVCLSMLLVGTSVMLVALVKFWTSHRFECSPTADFSLRCWSLTAFAPSLLNTLSTMGLGAIYNRLAERLNRWENHRTLTEHNNALIVKIFAFQMVNTYTSLFYVAFIRPETHGFQKNGLFGLGESFKDTCAAGTCGSLLAVQLVSHALIKPLPKFAKDVVVPYLVRALRARRWTSSSSSFCESDDRAANVLVREWLKPCAGDFVLWEMNEKIIMFGTTMMFASLFPLAPLFTLIIGLIDIRIDAHRLLWFNRKPIPQISNGIGIWLPILTFLQYCAVFTNAFIVAFTSDFCPKFFKDVMYCSIENRLLIVIIFQNLVFLLKYALSAMIPSIPASIKVAKRKKHYILGQILEKGDVPHRIRNRKRTRFAKIAWITSNRRTTKTGRRRAVQKTRVETLN